MELRKANKNDLPQLRKVYEDIVEEMKRCGVDLWNEFYPYEALPGDIEADRLWLLCDGGNIAAAFALEQLPDNGDIKWQDGNAPALTMMRLGVSPAYQHGGVGRLCIDRAREIARQRGCEFIRLFVVDINTPAEQFYIKCGFIRGEGRHIELIPDLCPQGLIEYGYEIRV